MRIKEGTMKAEVSGLVRSGKPAVKPPVYPHPAQTTKTSERRKPSSRHLSRMHSPVTTEVREVGLLLHEILALADIMREAYGNGDIDNLRHRLPLLMSKAVTLESALSNIIKQMNCAHL